MDEYTKQLETQNEALKSRVEELEDALRDVLWTCDLHEISEIVYKVLDI